MTRPPSRRVRRAMRRALTALSDPDQEIFSRARFEGQDYRRIALDLGISVVDVERVLETTTPSTAAEIAAVLLSIGLPHDTKIVVEAGMANYLARSLRAMGFSVLVLDAVRARRFLEIRRNKTDENDARGLAEMGRLRNVPGHPVHVKDAACQHLRSKLVVRDLASCRRFDLCSWFFSIAAATLIRR